MKESTVIVKSTCSSFKDMTMGTPLYVLVYIALLSINFKNFRVHAGCKKPTPEETKVCFDKLALNNKDDSKDVSWMETCVMKYYCLQPEKGENSKEFKKPVFEDELKYFSEESYFQYAAKRIENFFVRNSDWTKTKDIDDYRSNDCVKLLAITDARYLYVTYVLFIKSGNKLTPCKKDSDDDTVAKFYLPKDVCFPRPYGSGTCTSDYDVGLIGRTSGELTVEFNNHFTETFKKPSEEVFDTNVYAFTLEYAMPELFIGLTGFFEKIVPSLDENPWYQMQELASAYFKMHKFRDLFYKEFKDQFLVEYKPDYKEFKSIPDRQIFFKKSIQNLEELDSKTQVKNIDDLRNIHNKVYEEQVKKSENNFDKRYHQNIVQYMSQMSIALVYAAEAYHTRGAMRHVVGDIQMNSAIIKAKTTVMNYWVSMIENWADCNKEYKHCTENDNVGVCLLKMSKYMYRTFNAMKRIYEALFKTAKIETINALRPAKLLPEYPSLHDPEKIAKKWLDFRGKVKEIPNFATNIKPFLVSVGCDGQSEKGDSQPLHFDCMKEIQAKVMEYNGILVSASAKSAHPIQAIFTLVPLGNQKTRAHN